MKQKEVSSEELSLEGALLALEDVGEVQHFLSDLCTPQEVGAMRERLKVAELLWRGGLSYREIHDLTGVSLATITRVARFLNTEPHQGYRAVFERLLGLKS